MKPLPTLEELHKLLICDAEHGELWWRARTPDMFKAGKQSQEQSCKSWNSRYAGKKAFTANFKGYKVGSLNKRAYRAHRVIWFMVHGEWPDEVDHENGLRHDNRLENLRNVTGAQNHRNQKTRTNNTSGHNGVYWAKQNEKWRVEIQAKGRRKHIGLFARLEDAISARKAADREHDFHENHGR